VASKKLRRFNEHDLHLLGLIGDQLGVAIEQGKLYKKLGEARKRYQTLLRQMITIQEQERRRIARELHDETSQQLTAMSLNLQALVQMMEMGHDVKDNEVKIMLKKIHQISVQASAEVVRLIRELRPTLLDTLGLPAAILNLAEANLSSRGIRVTHEFKGFVKETMTSEMELTLFRITQEIMSNIVKHAEAKNVSIFLECDEGECVLIIEDDGRGFNIKEITRIENDGRGAGLFGIRERMAIVGGKGYIESEPGKGAKAIARIPLGRGRNRGQD